MLPSTRLIQRLLILHLPEAEIQRLRTLHALRGQTHVVAHAVGDFLPVVADHDEGLVVGQTEVANVRLISVVAAQPVLFEAAAGAAGGRGSAIAGVFASFEEVDAFVAHRGGHAGEGFVEDDDVRFVDERADEEDDALLGGVELAEEGGVRVFDVELDWREYGAGASDEGDPGEMFSVFNRHSWGFLLGGDGGVGVELGLEVAEGSAHVEVTVVVQGGFREESFCVS